MSETASRDSEAGAAKGGEGVVAERILAIFAKETGIDRTRLTPEATIEELGIPSIDIVQTIFELESQFDIEIPVVPTEKGAEFTTVGDLVSHVMATIHKQAARKDGIESAPGHNGAG